MPRRHDAAILRLAFDAAITPPLRHFHYFAISIRRHAFSLHACRLLSPLFTAAISASFSLFATLRHAGHYFDIFFAFAFVFVALFDILTLHFSKLEN
jgi:hypothetical protein